MQSDLKTRLVIILGPTAVGKTDLSILLAERLGGEIISVDSRLFYRGMDIGTAKPSRVDQKRVPHYLIDVSNPDETWNLAVFQKLADELIADIAGRGKIPFLVGGTGQYIQAILDGWQIPLQQPDPRLRVVLENWALEIGAEQLHARLKRLDPESAQRIDFRNVRRTIRALEVVLCTGQKFSSQRSKQESPYQVLKIGLKRSREDLYRRVDQRVDQMFSQGLIEEVNALLHKGYAYHLPTMSAIGYGEVVEYLRGRLTLDEARMLIKRSTRHFVRKQANWFKESDPSIHWFDMAEDPLESAEILIKGFIYG